MNLSGMFPFHLQLALSQWVPQEGGFSRVTLGPDPNPSPFSPASFPDSQSTCGSLSGTVQRDEPPPQYIFHGCNHEDTSGIILEKCSFII